MSNMVEDHDYRGCKIEIFYDEGGGGFNPRDDYSNLSRLVFPDNSHHVSPNEIDFNFRQEDDDPEDGGPREDEGLGAWVKRRMTEDYDVIYITNVYRFEHGGVAYNTGGFSCPWDSGQCGWAVVTNASAAEIGTKPEDFAEVVSAEVEDYSKWANGEVYYWRAVDPDGDVIESCGGYLGYEGDNDYMVTEGKAAIDYFLSDRDEKANALAADAMAQLVHG